MWFWPSCGGLRAWSWRAIQRARGKGGARWQHVQEVAMPDGSSSYPGWTRPCGLGDCGTTAAGQSSRSKQQEAEGDGSGRSLSGSTRGRSMGAAEELLAGESSRRSAPTTRSRTDGTQAWQEEGGRLMVVRCRGGEGAQVERMQGPPEVTSHWWRPWQRAARGDKVEEAWGGAER